MNVKLLPALPALVLVGLTVIVPSPSFAFASVKVACAVSPDVWPVAVNCSVAFNSSWSKGTSQVVEILPASSAVVVQGW